MRKAELFSTLLDCTLLPGSQQMVLYYTFGPEDSKERVDLPIKEDIHGLFFLGAYPTMEVAKNKAVQLRKWNPWALWENFRYRHTVNLRA